MLLVTEPVTLAELASMAQGRFDDLVKVVVDVSRGVIAVDADMHDDEEAFLLDRGSRQVDRWGVNLYPARTAPRTSLGSTR